MKKFKFIFCLIMSFNCLGQFDSTRVDLYKALINKVSSNTYSNLICINDYFIDIEPRGVSGLIFYPDSLVYSSKFRNDLNNVLQLDEDSIYFENLSNYHHISQESRLQQLIITYGKRPFFIYLDAPIGGQELYDYMYKEKFKQISLIFPVYTFKFENAFLNPNTFYYSVVITKKKDKVKYRIKKVD